MIHPAEVNYASIIGQNSLIERMDRLSAHHRKLFATIDQFQNHLEQNKLNQQKEIDALQPIEVEQASMFQELKDIEEVCQDIDEKLANRSKLGSGLESLLAQITQIQARIQNKVELLNKQQECLIPCAHSL